MVIKKITIRNAAGGSSTVDIGAVGSNINYSDDVTRTLEDIFAGTDGSSTGKKGLIPAPVGADISKFLKADGTWSETRGFKTVLQSEDGAYIYFYRKDNAVLGTDIPDATITLEGGSGGGEDKKIWLTDNTPTTGTNYATIYKLYQGANAPDAQADPATLVGTINIPKDMVVSAGSTVEIFFDNSDNTLHEGTVSGPDVTEAIKGAGNPGTTADAGQYIKLTIANATSTNIYIKLTDLVEAYTGGTTAEITVSVDSNNEITATINDIAGTKITYTAAAEAVYGQVIAPATFDENETYYTRTGEGTTTDPYVYTEDATVDASNFDDKVAAGLYTVTTPAVARESVSAALARLDARQAYIENETLIL